MGDSETPQQGQSEADRSEHDKLLAVQVESQAIGEFIDGMSRLGLVLCEEPGTRRNRSRWPVSTSRSINSILARWFEIDEDKLEAEKRAMIAAMRAMNETPDMGLSGGSDV
jgi:hypothetical protein